mmetsp:Transcript_20748/g.71672  ORF Transcript_20748/g.71672 Transcript_20748/m.71672 type:complete len:220 (+) Transcript_20748:139-798(+)
MNPQNCTNDSSGIRREPSRSELRRSIRHAPDAEHFSPTTPHDTTRHDRPRQCICERLLLISAGFRPNLPILSTSLRTRSTARITCLVSGVNLGDQSSRAPRNTLQPLTNFPSPGREGNEQLHLREAQKHEKLHRRRAQKHFLCTIVGPDSSYSPLEIHICWKVLKDDKMEPPIQTEYLRSGGATTLIFIVDGARAVISFVMRSPMPVNIVVPPDSTMFE